MNRNGQIADAPIHRDINRLRPARSKIAVGLHYFLFSVS